MIFKVKIIENYEETIREVNCKDISSEIENCHTLQWIVHKRISQKLLKVEYSISEFSTGLRLLSGTNGAELLKSANEMLNNCSTEFITTLIKGQEKINF